MRSHRGRTSPVGATLLAAGLLVMGGTDAIASSGAPPTAENLAALRRCESSDDYGARTGNGYYGAYQFSLSTWRSVGYDGVPSDASPAVQDDAARRLQARDGWSPWPACSWVLGLR